MSSAAICEARIMMDDERPQTIFPELKKYTKHVLCGMHASHHLLAWPKAVTSGVHNRGVDSILLESCSHRTHPLLASTYPYTVLCVLYVYTRRTYRYSTVRTYRPAGSQAAQNSHHPPHPTALFANTDRIFFATMVKIASTKLSNCLELLTFILQL